MLAAEQVMAERSVHTERSVLLFADNRVAVYPEAQEVLCDGAQAPISAGPFKLATILARDPDRVVPHRQLCMMLWKYYSPASYACARQEVGKLRKALDGELGGIHGAIRIFAGVGYYAVESLSSNHIPKDKPGDEVYLAASGRVRINATRWCAVRDNERIELGPTDFRILRLLASHQDMVIPTSQFCQIVHGGVSESSRSNVRGSIRRIRFALGPELGDPKEGVLGMSKTKQGYCLASKASL